MMCCRFAFVVMLFLYALYAGAQAQSQSSADDSLARQKLPEVIVKSFEQNRRVLEVAAAINYIGPLQLQRFYNTSLLPALNSTPGVRMEERSPGSYRLSIRGSSLRSPFGVRNVKVYWDGIPFTDPGGSTYLNQFGFYNFHSVEVIKGPAGSLYGSGTGGVILIRSQPASWQAGADADYLHGSFALNSYHAQIRLGGELGRNTFNFSQQSSNGYRHHTAMKREVATWQTQIKTTDKQQLSASVLYGNLYYQTPGALTKSEYDKNPKAARPPLGNFPGADAAQAAIYQKTFLAGISNNYRFSDDWQNTTVVYGAFSQIKNPTFRNYEKRLEPHFGGRTVFTHYRSLRKSSLQVVFGGEGQHGFFNTKTFQNASGNPGAVLTDDDIDTWTYTVFAQGDLHLPHHWNVTAGLSLNQSSVSIQRLSVPLSMPQKRTYNGEWAPRLAVAKNITPNIVGYGSVSKGFSPPTVQEVLPSTSVISTSLQAEHGISYEAGVKGTWLHQRLYVEVNAFRFQLQNAIVQRRDSTGADYFINAGFTRQRGLESQASFQLMENQKGLLSTAKVWASHTWYHFRYGAFRQIDNNYAGKQLPGVASHTVAAGLDAGAAQGGYLRLSYFFSAPIALNDANSAYAPAYHLLGGRAGWQGSVGHALKADFFAGVENIFNARYSLGNDINAAGGRFYNAAPGVNYFFGISFKSMR